MSLTLKFRGREFNKKLSRATSSGLKRAAVFLHTKHRQEVSRPNQHRHRAQFTSRQRAARGGQKTGVVYENMHNRYAGRPPFLRTGTGRGEIVWEHNGSDRRPAVRIGVTKKGLYMAFLDLGTRRIRPRPWLRATLDKYRSQVARLAATGGKREVGR